MSSPASPGYQPPGQGTASAGDITTQLQMVVRQLSSSNTNILALTAALTAALDAINFPENVKGYTVATLPSSPAIGSLAYVTDGTSGLAWGAQCTGGHSTFYVVNWNGSQWSVMGK